MICPVCAGSAETFFTLPGKNREFCQCRKCTVLFQVDIPDEAEEKARYDLHRNDSDDPGYKQWLSRFITTGILPWYRGGRILDFGSGPEPALTDMLKVKGYRVVSYDKYYAPVWPENQKFSLVILSEVLEHLDDPVLEFQRIRSVAEPGSRLVFQTYFRQNSDPRWFQSWWYKEDITHIRFYNAASLYALGKESGWKLVYQDGKSMGCFRKA